MKNIHQEVKKTLGLLKDIKIKDYKIDTAGIGTSDAKEFDHIVEDILKISTESKEDEHGVMVHLKDAIDKIEYVRVGKPGEPNYISIQVDDFDSAKDLYPEAKFQEGEGWKLLEMIIDEGKIYISNISEIEFYFPNKDETLDSAVEKEEVYEAEANTDTEGMFQQKYEEEKQKRITLMADFQNYQRRVDNEKSTWGAMSNMSLIKDILEIFDDLEMAIIDESLNLDSAKSAVRSAQSKLIDSVSRSGIERIEVKIGDDFDKEKMEAVSTVAVQDESQKGKIIAVITSAYKYANKDFILKAAKVVVGK